MAEALKKAGGCLPQMTPRALSRIKYRGREYVFDARLSELREADGPGRVELRESESDMLDYAFRSSAVKNGRMKMAALFMQDLAGQGRL